MNNLLRYLRARNYAELSTLFNRGYTLRALFKSGEIRFVHQVAWDTIQVVDSLEEPKISEFVRFDDPRIAHWEITSDASKASSFQTETPVEVQPYSAGSVHPESSVDVGTHTETDCSVDGGESTHDCSGGGGEASVSAE